MFQVFAAVLVEIATRTHRILHHMFCVLLPASGFVDHIHSAAASVPTCFSVRSSPHTTDMSSRGVCLQGSRGAGVRNSKEGRVDALVLKLCKVPVQWHVLLPNATIPTKLLMAVGVKIS